MKIVVTGGGTGGHFYPIIAVVERIRELATERKLIEPTIIYIGPSVFDNEALIENGIEYRPSPAGRMRRHHSARNIFSMITTFFGVIKSIFQLFIIYPDVVFSTGGFAAFPTLYAARILAIPVIIYDADSKPGRVNAWSASFARHIAIAHADADKEFPESVRNKIALVGHPIRKEIEEVAKEGGHEFLKVDPNVPTIFVMGGSQGAEAINNVIMDTLPQLVQKYNVIHQVGTANLEGIQRLSEVVLRTTAHEEHYRAFGLLNTLGLRMAAGITNLIIMRAGSGTIFEVASWGIPAIIIPIPEDVSHDQTRNAFSYARTGAAIVIEQQNLKPNLLLAEIERVLSNPIEIAAMAVAAKKFARHDAARKIARIIIDTSLEHESA
jgi:UDP-N-acetylglucosamine--N-acetylmuramyl-(pentapeptide) pyrophosphoryl-undecaprenol N-acetylglucosamine transferase